jgi:hypothetical protein
MEAQLASSRADCGRTGSRMIIPESRWSVLAAALTLLMGGCYTSECEKMGYAEGTPENARCVYQLRSELTQQLNQMTQQLNGLSQQLAKSRAEQPTPA